MALLKTCFVVAVLLAAPVVARAQLFGPGFDITDPLKHSPFDLSPHGPYGPHSPLRVCSKSPMLWSVSVVACTETDPGTSPRSADGASTESY